MKVERKGYYDGDSYRSAWPEDFYSNYTNGGVAILLAQSLQKRGVAGIRISDIATDNKGNQMPGCQALFISDEARKAFHLLEDAPEMIALKRATNYNFHEKGEPKLDNVIPTFATEKRKRQLTAMYWDTYAARLRFLAGNNKSESLMLKAQEAQSRASKLLSPLWLNLTLPNKAQISAMVEDVVNKRLPLVSSSAQA